MTDSRVTKEPTEARQGSLGRPVLYVLIGAMILCAIALFVLVGFTGVEAPPPSIGVEPEPVGPGDRGAAQPAPR